MNPSDWKEAKKFLKALGVNTWDVRDEYLTKHPAESPRHFFIKSLIIYILRKEGHKVMTEVKCKDINAQPDILDLTTREVIEVETEPTGKKEKIKLNQYSDNRIKDLFIIDTREISDYLPKAIRQLKDELGY